MAGFFEFSMMRVRGDVDQRRLAELFYEYLAAILGVILKLPPAKQALASRQLRSRYLERLPRSSSGGRRLSAAAAILNEDAQQQPDSAGRRCEE
jgi:hypothetical protein